MHTRIEDGEGVISFEVCVSYDAANGGWVVAEKDGPCVEVRWGPMPYSLVEHYIRQRAEMMIEELSTLRPFRHDHSA